MKAKRKIFIAFILNLFFSIFEFFGGIITGSIAIASDAIHDFGDATSIGIAYFLEKVSDKKPNKAYTYGYARFSVLGGLITTLILLVSSGIVIYNAILRIIYPIQIYYDGMLVFAVVGFVVNLTAGYFTHGGKSINQKAVNIHILEDALGWLFVIISAIIIKFTNLYIIDPISSIVVALFVIINCVKNLVEILRIFLIKTPNDVNIDEIINHVKQIDGVVDVHHLHVWTLDGEINCATLHLVVNSYNAEIKNMVKEELNEHGISHVTIEMESDMEECEEENCNVKVRNSTCHHCHNH